MNNRRIRRRTVLAALAGIATTTAGCGGDGERTPTGTEVMAEVTVSGPDTATRGTAEETESPTTATADGGASPTTAKTDSPSTTHTTTADDNPTTTATSSATPDLDLREANVMAVETSERNGDVRFAVTLYHDDEGEAGYANWWQVETIDGSRLGRRELLHAHGTREFTRSTTVSVPDGTTCVVVRGHDETHGYGGQTALVDLDSGAVRLVRQGEERRSFDAADCP
jgi:hypothetical protein